MIALDLSVVSLSARYPKSTIFSGWPRAKVGLPPGLTAVVRRGGGVASCDRVGEAAVADAAAEPAAPELLVFSVETAVRRYPDLEIDDRIIRRRRRAGNTAELREPGIRSAAGTTRCAARWCVERPAGDRLRRSDLPVRQGYVYQAFTGGRRRRHAPKSRRCE